MSRVFISFVISIICHGVWPQNKSNSQFQFGIELGTGMQTTTNCPVKTKPRLAFMGGIWVQIKVSKRWTMHAELTNISKGTGLGLHQPKYGDYWLNLNYLEVPILFQYNKQNVYFEFGPSLAALINSGEYTNGGVLHYHADLYPFCKKDFSFNLGAGFVLNEKWCVGLRLIHSILPIRNKVPEISQPVYNRGIILAVSRPINFRASKNTQAEGVE
jgi:hypothetical protein